MQFSRNERIAVLIDGPELRETVGGVGIDLDFKKLLSLFEGASQLVRMNFYFLDRDDGDSHSLRPLIDWLDYNGYMTIACSGREGDGGSRRSNKNFLNVRLSVDALELASTVDHVVIFSGDAVLSPVVEALKNRGLRVSIVSTLQLRPPMVADDLRRRADQFIDIADIIEHVAIDAGRPVVAKRRRSRESVGVAAQSESTRSQKDVDASTS